MSYVILKEHLLNAINFQPYFFKTTQEELLNKVELLMQNEGDKSISRFAALIRAEISTSGQYFNYSSLSREISFFLNDSSCPINNEYLILLKREQKLRKKVEQLNLDLQALQNFIENNERVKKYIPYKKNGEYSNMVKTLKSVFKNIKTEKADAYSKWFELRKMLNSGNLRHVVSHLIQGEGLNRKEFAEKIGYTETDITNLVENFIVPNDLVNAICSYFDIEVAEEFIDYVKNSY